MLHRGGRAQHRQAAQRIRAAVHIRFAFNFALVVEYRAVRADINLNGYRTAVRFCDPVTQAGSHGINRSQSVGCHIQLLGCQALILRGTVREHNQINIQAKFIKVSLLFCINSGDRDNIGLHADIERFTGCSESAVTGSAGCLVAGIFIGSAATAAAGGQAGSKSGSKKHCDKSLIAFFHVSYLPLV